MVTYDNATGTGRRAVLLLQPTLICLPAGSYMTTFFGGMGLSYVTDCNEIVQDIRTPFVNVISTMTRFADGTMTGTVPLWT